jgi:hypothetical protein
MTSDVRPCTAVRDSDLDTALKVVLSAAEGIVHDFPLKDDPEWSPLEGKLSSGGILRRLLIGRERRAPAYSSYGYRRAFACSSYASARPRTQRSASAA